MNTETPNDGGPAFPVAIMERQYDCQIMTGYDFGVQGMTLRDYFAAKALGGYSQNHEVFNDKTHDQVARMAYVVADAMLAERNRKP